MSPELIYLLKVNAGIALFYAFYKLVCCRDTFFRWRRIALLAFLALSVLYPLLNIQTWIQEQPAMNELADYYAIWMMADATTVNTAIAPSDIVSQTPDFITLLGGAYCIGVLLLSVRFILQLTSIFHLAAKSRNATIGGIQVKLLPTPANPFSFFRWIFIYPQELNEEEKQEVMTHEQTHARQWHSIDVMISEIITILCWPNPFMWLLKTEIRLNLEYLADHTVTESCPDTRQYQYHLLGLANQKRQTGLHNNFNVSHLKNRIIMMNKKRTRQTGRIKYALFAPLTLALLLVSNIEAVARTAERLITPDETVSEMTVDALPQQDKGTTTFNVTITDKQGKALPNVKIQTQLNGKLVTFVTGSNGKAAVKLEMGNLKNAYMHASAPDGRGYYFILAPGKTDVTIDIDKEQPAPPAIGPDGNGIYSVVEEMPEFPGGMNECLKFLSKNVKYPTKAIENKQQGKVIIQFVINEDGSTSGYKVVRSITEELDKEALRVAEAMPKWKPGMQKGKAVKCKYTIPITFSLAPTTPPAPKGKVDIDSPDANGVYGVVEEMPEYPGGMNECLKFISKSVQYPESAKAKGIQGKVIVQCIINTDGSVSDVKIVRSVSTELDNEAVRIIESMPKWKPAMHKGKVVKCKYTMPIAFSLK